MSGPAIADDRRPFERLVEAASVLSDAELVVALSCPAPPAEDPAARLLRFALREVLEQRYPTVAAALEAWTEDLSFSRTYDEVLLEAAAAAGLVAAVAGAPERI